MYMHEATTVLAKYGVSEMTEEEILLSIEEDAKNPESKIIHDEILDALDVINSEMLIAAEAKS